MTASGKKTFIVKNHGEEEAFEVTGTRMVIDEANTNRVTVYDGDDVVAQLNSVESVRPK